MMITNGTRERRFKVEVCGGGNMIDFLFLSMFQTLGMFKTSKMIQTLSKVILISCDV
jgi:hypothetical protein